MKTRNTDALLKEIAETYSVLIFARTLRYSRIFT